MNILSKAIYRFDVVHIKLPMTFLTDLGQYILKFVWKDERPQIAKAIFKEKMELEESGSLTSDYSTKLQPSIEYSTSTQKKDI